MTGGLTIGESTATEIPLHVKSVATTGSNYIRFYSNGAIVTDVGYSKDLSTHLYNGNLTSHPTLVLGRTNNLTDGMQFRYSNVYYNVLHAGNYQNYPNTKVGVSTIWLYPENNNEINFGGTNTSSNIFFGYRAKDSRVKPIVFVFGNNNSPSTSSGGNCTIMGANYYANASSGPHFYGRADANNWAYIRLYSGTTYGDIAITTNSSASTTAGGIELRPSGGEAKKGGVTGEGYLFTQSSGHLTTIGSTNISYCHFYTTAPKYYFNKTTVVNGNITGLNGEFSLLSGEEHFQHRYWGGVGSYSYEVLLLLPIPATNNLTGYNTIDGTISGYTNGANQCFWVDVKISTIYNSTFWNIKSIGSFLSNQYVLKKCKYNDIWYYCIEIPYRDNRIDSYYFRGVIRSTIAGGLSTITLPYRIKYKTKANGNNAEVINNSEINSSLSTTLKQGGITYVSFIEDTYYQNIKPHLSNSITSGTTDLRWKCVYSYNLDISSTSTFSGKATFNGGLSGTLTGSLSGNATTATTLQTSRTINGTSFNGSANITTSYWGTTRTIWGQSVNGSANVSGAMTGVTSITATGLIRTSNLFSAGDGGSDNAYGYYNCTRPNTANTGYVCYAMVRSGTYAFGLGYYNNEIVLSSANTSRQFNARWLQLNSSRLLINGNIEATGAVTAKSSSSDIRLKKNIKEYNALDIIHKLKSVKYYWNDTAKANSPIFNDNEEHYGLIAQDLLINGYSQWVSNCFKDYYVIQYERLIPVLWRGIQQVDNEVATLKKKIATLEKELSSVKRQLSL